MIINNDLINMLNLVPNSYSIGVHGITGNGDYIKKADSILENGLNNNTWGGILSNVMMLGQKKDLTEDDYLILENYIFSRDSNNNAVNILVAIPEIFEDIDGFENYVGHFNKCLGFSKGEEYVGDNLPLNRLVESIQLLPKHFILGYFYNYKGKIICKINKEFIDFQSKEKQIEFYELVKSTIINSSLVIYLPEIAKKKPSVLSKIIEIDTNNEYIRQYKEYLKRKNKKA